MSLYNLSNKYNYNLYLDKNHVIFNFLKSNNNIINEDYLTDTIEVLPPISYDNIYVKLNELFMNEKHKHSLGTQKAAKLQV